MYMTKLNKRLAISSILPSCENNKPIWKLFKPNKPKAKDSSVFRKSKFCGGLHILVIHFKIHFEIIHFNRN